MREYLVWRKIFVLPSLTAALACGTAQAPSLQAAGTAVATITDGAPGCPGGGHVLRYGVDKNGNGVLDADEIVGKTEVCDGTSGLLTRLTRLAAGTICAHGGVAVESGLDANHNGTLEDAEVTHTDPICSADGRITSIVGNTSVTSAADLTRMASLETLSGNLYVDLAGMTGVVELPSLTRVGGNIDVTGGDGGDDDDDRLAFAPSPAAGATSVTMSFPILASVGGYVDATSNITLSLPSLVSVHQGLACDDANAVLTSLREMGDDLNCGSPNTVYQLTHLNFGIAPAGRQDAFPNAVTIGTTNDIADAGRGGVFLVDPNTVALDLPQARQIGSLILFGRTEPHAAITAPQLTTVDVITLHGAKPRRFSGPVYDFNSIVTASDFRVLGYVQETQTTSQSYSTFLSGLSAIGGELNLESSSEIELSNDHLTALGALDIAGNALLTRVSLPQLTQITVGDANRRRYIGNMGQDIASCDNSEGQECASVCVVNNPNLQELNLGHITAVPGIVVLKQDAKLTAVAGAESITTIDSGVSLYVGGSIDQSVNVSLGVISTGLTSLPFTNVAAAKAVVISQNPNLIDISALHLAPGPTTSCPIIADSPKLNYCAVKNLIAAYNAACPAPEQPSDWNLANPCSGVTCPSGTCSVDCSVAAGYSCVATVSGGAAGVSLTHASDLEH